MKAGDTVQCLRNSEGVVALLHWALQTLEPTLVTNLVLEDVQVAAADGHGEQLMTTTLIAIGGTGQQLVLVVDL